LDVNTNLNHHKINYDEILIEIANYVCAPISLSKRAYATAKLCLMDSIGCAALALNFEPCTRLLGPYVTGSRVDAGARVMGTDFEMDPVKAAWDNGALIRWLDYNDTWLAAEWGHPSDNLGAILAVADFLVRKKQRAFSVHDVLTLMIKAYEIQGVLALSNSFNRVGIDHVVLVKLASTAVVAHMFDATYAQVLAALSQVWVDGQALRTYRHAPNVGARKSWAAGDACARAVQLVLLTLRGEMGYPTAISAPKWGATDVLLSGTPLTLLQPFGSYVMENILFKIAYPAEFHAQTAVECAIALYAEVRSHLHEIERIELTTHESAIRIISKTGSLNNPADRDHCLQYMVAVGLLTGQLQASDYEDDVAQNPQLDALRAKMSVKEDKQFSEDYLDASKRSIANAVQVFYANGTCSDKVEIHYPLGHRRRRDEGVPKLWQKFKENVAAYYPQDVQKKLVEFFEKEACEQESIADLMSLLVVTPQ
jgi:2-methylcitrate dehydratase